jgi:chemotaxis protein methyltransferase CheR
MPLNPSHFDFVRTLLHQRSAIVLGSEKAYLVETRLLPLARQEGLPSVDALVERLRQRPSMVLEQRVVEALATNETSFFRDLRPFDVLRDTVLPGLMQRRAGERALTIWCAACSSGQEPYSVALLIREHFPRLLDWRLRILACDLSTEMIERARQGRFNQIEVNRGLPARLLVKYFERHGLGWQLRDDVRRMVEFQAMNLAGMWPPLPPLDVVLLRNVLIYFDVDVRRQVLGKVRRLLRPDGALFLGGAETTLNLDDAFERVQLNGAGYYRLRGN